MIKTVHSEYTLWYTYYGGSMMYKKLKQIRYKNNMTAKEVAERVGISKAFYCQLENCKRRLSYDTAIKIAGVFNVKPDYLFYNDTVDCLNAGVVKEENMN